MHSTPMGRDGSIELAAVPAAVRQARQFATETLIAGAAHPSVIDTVVLLVSELATNAIPRPTTITQADEAAPAATMAVRIAAYPTGRIRIEVRDGNSGQVPEKTATTADDEHGRGLMLVEALSADWGYYTHAGLKTVWAEVDCAACLPSADEPLRPKPALRRPVALDSRKRRQVTVSARPARNALNLPASPITT
jgi:Histidine kinase-like ATPase domain